MLPVGSPPGMWGLESMELDDKVDNKYSVSFAELVAFEKGRRSYRSRFSFVVSATADER